MNRTYVRILISEMRTSPAIPLSAHAVLETVAAPAIMAAPFLLGFGQGAAIVAFVVGALLLGLAIQAAGPQRKIPLSAHAGFEYTLALVAGIGGLVVGIATGEWGAASFLVGVGVAQVALTAATRFSAPIGA
jgi:hypothetical protein